MTTEKKQPSTWVPRRIAQPKLPPGWDEHHTLYYRKRYSGKPAATAWRNKHAMIVPIERTKHAKLHIVVPPPEDLLPSDWLAGYVLCLCEKIEQEQVTRLEGFTHVRDELYGLSRRRPATLGREALRFVDFFDEQRVFMSEVPILGQ